MLLAARLCNEWKMLRSVTHRYIPLSLCRWPSWKPIHTYWDSLLLYPLCTVSLSSLRSRMVSSQQQEFVFVTNIASFNFSFTLAHLSIFLFLFLLRHPVLEQQTVFRGPVRALHHIWSVSVSGGAAVHSGQRNQLCGAGQRLHRPSHRPVENHQGHGCQSKSAWWCFFFLIKIFNVHFIHLIFILFFFLLNISFILPLFTLTAVL